MDYISLLPNHISNPKIELYYSDNYLVLDYETTNYDFGHPRWGENRLVHASWKFQNKLKHNYANEFNQDELCSDLEKCDFVVAHNAKFELGWTKRIGYPIEDLITYCTQIGEKTIISNRRGMRQDLNSCLERRGLPQKETLVSRLIKAGICPSRIPKRFLVRYCDQDVLACEALFLQQREELLKAGLVKTAFTKNLLTPVLTELEFTGLCLDKERVEKVYTTIRKRYEELRVEYEQFTGGINRNSPKQVAEFLYDKLGFDELKDKKGNPIRTEADGRQTGETVINQLKVHTEPQRRFIELHKEFTVLTTQLSKALEKFKEACDNEDLIFGNFNQNVADTDRLSSTGAPPYKVQLQNINRDFKPLFKARYEDWDIVEDDQAQLEFRIAAQFGNCDNAIKDIRRKVDVHTRTANILTDAGQSTERQGAKEHTFKPLFGGTSGTRAEQTYYSWFKEQYPGVISKQEEWIDQAIKEKIQYIEETGKIFYWPNCRIGFNNYIFDNENIRNAPIQYFAGELVQLSVVFTWHLLKKLNFKAFLINTVHDSIIGEVPKDEQNDYKQLVEWATTEGVYHFYKQLHDLDFVVPLETEFSINTHWADKEKWKEQWLS